MPAAAGGHSGAVAIIRLSGPNAIACSSKIFRPGPPAGSAEVPGAFQPTSHRIYYGHVVEASGNIVDEVLLLPMLRPRSYTCEDVIELHCHGGGVSAQRVLDLCLAAGCRLATAGEFTLRAFLNGRLDLSQAESVAQLVSARTVSAADSALAGLKVGGAAPSLLATTPTTALSPLPLCIPARTKAPVCAVRNSTGLTAAGGHCGRGAEPAGAAD